MDRVDLGVEQAEFCAVWHGRIGRKMSVRVQAIVW
jgi:hypothetical protein